MSDDRRGDLPSHPSSHGSDQGPEFPREEPEIIPPGGSARAGGRGGSAERVFVYVDAEGRTRRVNVTPPGPFTIIFILLALAVIAAAIFAVVLGALVFLLPIALIALAGLIAYAYARGAWLRWKGR